MKKTLIALLTIYCFLIGYSSAAISQDLCTIVFEDNSIVIGGDPVQCDLYYILLGDDGGLRTGDMLQLTRRHDLPNKYFLAKARFKLDDAAQRITIHWRADEGEKMGAVEQGRFTSRVGPTGSRYYTITRHSGDQSQEGLQLRVRQVDFELLPNWARQACLPSILAKLTPEQQYEYHKHQAESIRMIGKIAEEYFK
ncbi:hypothetical protein [Stieleria varia]|uniref:Uncharacterized protein n=1 Tax=Stieleria varia TaxID=2528005 RepID=A0A5C5ZPL7_9BACT|nr:hypothetical protein [Stieleria varia]TWT89170.1 hypothetical protein Pla52n_69030 [Stieleria varia]